MREWLRSLSPEDRHTIGADIQTVQFRWPMGMPEVRKMDAALWEVRSRISHRCKARVLFTVKDGEMILLHGFVKKRPATSPTDMKTALVRKKAWNQGG